MEIKLRFIAALLIVLLLWFFQIPCIKLQILFVILGTPQIFRKQFTPIFGIYTRRVRVQLGPAAISILGLSLLDSFLATTVIIGLLAVIGILNIPIATRYEEKKRMHGKMMRAIYILTVLRLALSLMKNAFGEEGNFSVLLRGLDF